MRKVVYEAETKVEELRRHMSVKDDRIKELEEDLKESERVSKSWKAQWKNLLEENYKLRLEIADLKKEES